jgi:two-component system sensor histidine kinase VanS
MDTDAVSRLLSLTSHELRSPLGVIRGYLKWLDQQAQPEQHRQAIAATLKASDRLADLLAELSALAQLQRREVALAREPTPLRSLVADCVTAFGTQPRGLATLRAPDLPDIDVTGDRALLQTALVSLATAVSLAQPNTAQLTIRAQGEPAESQWLRLEMTGTGVEPAGAEAPLNLLRGGLGLRLAMAGEIVAAHGGRIAELHTDGRLTGMIVWLPVVDA